MSCYKTALLKDHNPEELIAKINSPSLGSLAAACAVEGEITI